MCGRASARERKSKKPLSANETVRKISYVRMSERERVREYSPNLEREGTRESERGRERERECEREREREDTRERVRERRLKRNN